MLMVRLPCNMSYRSTENKGERIIVHGEGARSSPLLVQNTERKILLVYEEERVEKTYCYM